MSHLKRICQRATCVCGMCANFASMSINFKVASCCFNNLWVCLFKANLTSRIRFLKEMLIGLSTWLYQLLTLNAWVDGERSLKKICLRQLVGLACDRRATTLPPPAVNGSILLGCPASFLYRPFSRSQDYWAHAIKNEQTGSQYMATCSSSPQAIKNPSLFGSAI